MLTRRLFCGCLAAGVAAHVSRPVAALANHNECAPFTADLQEVTSPDNAIAMLIEGHKRFITGSPLRCDAAELVHGTEAKQTPFACIVGCIDSRVPPEVVLDRQIGDIFVARVAGNYPNNDILGSMEYATKVAGAKAILVLGHSSCGAIKGAVDDVKLGNLTGLLASIMPAVEETPLHGERSSKNHEFVEAVAEANVKRSVELMTRNSEVLSELVHDGKLRIIGALHDVHSGKIRFLI